MSNFDLQGLVQVGISTDKSSHARIVDDAVGEIETLRQQLHQAQTKRDEALRRVAEIKYHADRMLAAIQADDFALDQEAQFKADALSFNATEDYLIWLEDQRLRDKPDEQENNNE